MNHAFGLSSADLEKIIQVFRQVPGLEEVVLYGSRAKGNYRPGSDIDLTLKGDKISLKILNRLSNELDDLLLPYSFDLSIYQQIENKDLVEHIDRVGVTIYQSSDV